MTEMVKIDTARKLEQLKAENRELKRRIKASIRYIERASMLGHLNGCEEIMDVVVETLNGDLR